MSQRESEDDRARAEFLRCNPLPHQTGCLCRVCCEMRHAGRVLSSVGRDLAGVIEDLRTRVDGTIVVRVDRLLGWAARVKSAQVALDLSKDPEEVARRAGQLQDISEDIVRVIVARFADG